MQACYLRAHTIFDFTASRLERPDCENMLQLVKQDEFAHLITFLLEQRQQQPVPGGTGG